MHIFVRKIVPEQHGFLKGRSVETNLCSFLHDVVPIVHNREQADVVYFDMTKAFDKVDHRHLLAKLDMYGLCPKYCKLFESYLSKRENLVRVSSCLSNPFLATSGVPQGSNLGPLLFLIFVNDLTSCVKYSKMLLFADDIKLYRRTNTVEDRVLLQRDVCSISLWCLTNGLVLNESKTKIISLSRKRDVLQFCYALDTTVISRVSLIRDLGVYLDTEILFNNQVMNIVNSSLSVFGIIVRISRNFRNPQCFLMLFRSLVLSRLEFSSVVWNSIGETNSTSIERVQRKFICVF
ncbi:MAG: reverse transcriptase family protein, partial [Anaplasma sp.]|nr:reverse transcriptase family protein [Anaplasma sp.]